MDKKINVNVNNNGKVYVETEDYKGESCVSAIKELLNFNCDISKYVPKEIEQYIIDKMKK